MAATSRRQRTVSRGTEEVGSTPRHPGRGEEQRRLRALGAVGDVCARCFDAEGGALDAPFNDRLTSIDPDDLRVVSVGSVWRGARRR
ncbi:sugar-binding domain-containing protein [Streptomyces sp. JW3]|uniref:sugar-binding domain-containing protein n=1 Tax=Streptomyces sp. JW3 TaxID=3456955 RepID=UPI003FA4D492